MRTHIALLFLAGSLAATPAAAQTAAAPSTGPRILQIPSRTPACTATQSRVGSDRMLVTSLSFVLRGALDRDLSILVDSTDRVIFLQDSESHESRGDTARSTIVNANLMPATPAGTVATIRIDRAALQRQLLDNDLRLPPMTPVERARAVGEPRELTAEELERAKSLSAWLLARRCAVGSR
jgi:hypothetical protein